MTPHQLSTINADVVSFFNAYAADHPDEQPEMIDWLAHTLITWVDPRALVTFAGQLPQVAVTGQLPKLAPVLY